MPAVQRVRSLNLLKSKYESSRLTLRLTLERLWGWSHPYWPAAAKSGINASRRGARCHDGGLCEVGVFWDLVRRPHSACHVLLQRCSTVHTACVSGRAVTWHEQAAMPKMPNLSFSFQQSLSEFESSSL